MSAKLSIVPSSPEDEWVRRLAELLDGEQWVLADTLLERYTLADYPSEDGVKTGLDAALRRDELALARQHGIIAKANHLRALRATSIAWPADERSSATSFTVHMRMRGADRRVEMAKRLRQAEREKSALTDRMLRRFRHDDNPKPGRPYEERMRRAIAAAVRREMLGGITTKRDDWWNVDQIVDASRDVAVRELRALASAIARGPSDGH